MGRTVSFKRRPVGAGLTQDEKSIARNNAKQTKHFQDHSKGVLFNTIGENHLMYKIKIKIMH